MSKSKKNDHVIPLERIFLQFDNPRHEPYETQAQVIEYLCNHEDILQLARDVVEHGLSPWDNFGVVVDHDAEGKETTYIAVEGNRRLCALMLLTDPDLSPPERKANFQKLAENWTPITQLSCVVLEDQSEIDLWLRRRHQGYAGGVGLKPWNPEQKARHRGSDGRNRVAQAFLNYAENEGLISQAARKGKLTTMQRFLGNGVMRETLGLDTSNPDDVLRNRTEADFELLSRQFIADLLSESPKVTSRCNKEDIEKYARELSALKGQNHERIEPEPITPEPQKPKGERRLRPGKTKRPQRLPYRKDIHDTLEQLDVFKLKSLYHSICDVSLQDHTPLLAVGVWSFFETLTACAGRDLGTDFHSFLSQQRLTTTYNLGGKRQVNPLRDALRDISGFGNMTKHHPTAAAFNSDQLANHMETLESTILALINDAISQKK